MNKEKRGVSECGRTEKCGEIMWIMWITWCITQFWLKNGGRNVDADFVDNVDNVDKL